MENNTTLFEGTEPEMEQDAVLTESETEPATSEPSEGLETTEVLSVQAYEPPSADVFVQPEPNHPPKKRKKAFRFGTKKIIALALCCSLLGGAFGAGGVAAVNGILNAKSSSTATVLQGSRNTAALSVSYVDTGKEMTAAEIYAANVNSTVGITTSATTNYFGYQTVSAAAGSGFILTENGYIVTNYHVIEDADSIKVTTYDDTVYEATVVGFDESNDLAVLKIDAEGLVPVILGDSDQMRVGDSVVAIGNPLGELTFSLTSGSVSALNRNVTIENLSMKLIQTDCAINSGNSGGALFNSYGEVIGITNAKYSGSGSSGEASIDNIGFAIPINTVRDIITQIIETGSILKPYLGISMYDLDSRYQRFGLTGVAIQAVAEDSPAEAAGLQADDIITKVNGKALSGSSELKNIVSAGQEGDVLKLTVYRKGETIEIEVTLTVKAQSALQKSQTTTQQSSGGQSYGGQSYGGQYSLPGGGSFPE